MSRSRMAALVGAVMMLVSIPMVSHADDDPTQPVPQEVPTHGSWCVTHYNPPYFHMCVL